MKLPRKKSPKTTEMAAWFDLWVAKQSGMTRRINDLERRLEEMGGDLSVIMAHVLPNHHSHIPPEVLNPQGNAPVQSPTIHG